MKIGYTEFSFGYAFTENLIRSLKSGPIGAPIFPNLNQEAQLGYDVRLDLPACPLFFQYKLPELMVKNTAKEISEHKLSGIAINFFRMPLMRTDLSAQHQLLMDWELRYPGKVYYATPCMENLSEFNNAYAHARVHRHTVFFSPRDIGPLPDSKAHSVAYRVNLSFGYVCSQPKKVPALTFDKVDAIVRGAFDDQRYLGLERVAADLRRQVLETVPGELRDLENAVRQRIRTRQVQGIDRPRGRTPATEEAIEEILVAREIARVGLGIDLLIAQPSTKESGA